MVHKVDKPSRENLLNFYDVVNDIFKDKNIGVFYTSEELEQKKAGCIFI